MLTREDARARVAKGAAHLDGLFPQWHDHIKVNEFDLGDACRCVLGQLDGNFHEAVRNREIIARPWYRSAAFAFDAAIAMGFDAPDAALTTERNADFALLQDAWIEVIEARRFPDTANRETRLVHDAVNP